MAAVEVAGLQVDPGLEEGDQPLEAVVCIKVVSADGHIDWQVMATRGLHTVEAMGAASYLKEYLKRGAFGDDDEG